MEMTPDIHIHIDLLEVEGGRQADADAIGDAIRVTLQDLLMRGPLPVSTSRGSWRLHDAVQLGPIARGAPAAVGAQIAHELYQGLCQWSA
jgi:hypothetical protein